VERHVLALLVGIDAYPAPLPPLRGCANDVRAFAEVLGGRVGPDQHLSVQVLTDQQATRAAVIEQFRQHLGQAGPDDVALFYYSGHGSQEQTPPELWDIEPDHLDETLVLVDSREPGQWDLADKELAGLIKGVSRSGAHLVVILDCCHSGSGTRSFGDGVRERRAPLDGRQRPLDTFIEGSVLGHAPPIAGKPGGPAQEPSYTRGAAGWALRAVGGEGVRGGDHVLLAACRADETAKEVLDLGQDRGAFSLAMETALREGGGEPTYRAVHRWVTAGVMKRVQGQHPQVEVVAAGDLDRPFLGGAIRPTPRYFTLSRLPDGWCIDGGGVHGVPEPVAGETTELAIYSLESTGQEKPLALASVTAVLPDRSRVSLSVELDDTRTYRAVVTAIPLKPLSIGIGGDQQRSAGLVAGLAKADSTLLALADPPTTAELVVQADDDGFEILRPGSTRPLVPTVRGPGSEARTVAALEHMARWMRLSTLHNPASQLEETSVRVGVDSDDGTLGDDGCLRLGYVGDRRPTFAITLTNTTEGTLWCALLDLTEPYGVFTDAFAAGSTELGPSQSERVTLYGEVADDLWRAGTLELTDQLKVVVSTSEFDPRTLEQDELDVRTVRAPETVRGQGVPRSTLERLLRRVVTRSLAPQPPVGEQIADWRTTDLFVTTTRPAAR
jgi:hypothetical protein